VREIKTWLSTLDIWLRDSTDWIIKKEEMPFLALCKPTTFFNKHMKIRDQARLCLALYDIEPRMLMLKFSKHNKTMFDMGL